MRIAYKWSWPWPQWWPLLEIDAWLDAALRSIDLPDREPCFGDPPR